LKSREHLGTPSFRVLCTNDDGYLTPGIRVLAEAAHAIGSVDVVAPDRERSASSNSLTLHRPLRKRRVPDGTIIVDGTPTDCVILAVMEFADRAPDLCVSGINHGPNLGEDVLYSGTVAAAMEATMTRRLSLRCVSTLVPSAAGVTACRSSPGTMFAPAR